MASNVSDHSGLTAGAPPRVGITTYLERAAYGVWHQPSAVLPRSYPDVVVAAGGAPVLLPPVGTAFGVLVEGLDALVLAGGADVDPARYGAAAGSRTVSRPDRDAFEFGLLDAALAAGLPVLGVCRGMQLLAVALGGALTQHLPDLVGNTGHQPAPAEFGTTRVRLRPGSVLAGLLGSETKVRCHHHQAVARLDGGLVGVGWADDGTLEAVEDPARPFLLGVQWHPEEQTDDRRLFGALVEAARRRREEQP